MPLYIKDDETAQLVGELAQKLQVTKQEAVKTVVKAQLDKLDDKHTFDAKLKAFYARNPLPPPTGEKADKAFFDELSGEFD